MSSLAPAALGDAVRAHDRAVANLGVPFWIGAEPTFTLRESLDPAWLCEAEGGDKEARAVRLLLALAPRIAPTGAVASAAMGAAAAATTRTPPPPPPPSLLLLRSAGRRYPGEKRPRFAFGAFFRRDGGPVWNGPPDPLQCASLRAPTAPAAAPRRLREALQVEMAREGAATLLFEQADGTPALAVRCSPGGGATAARAIDASDPLLKRPGAHAPAAEGAPTGLDGAAAQGLWLFAFGVEDGALAVELPGFGEVAAFLAALGWLERAAQRLELPALVLRGYAPPVDAQVALLTVTPDPGVVEVNLAPAPDLETFAAWSQAAYAAAAEAGLSPERFGFNGQASDSGGGGQLTFGGFSPRASPFLRFPLLLSSLVRATNHHPSLSYLFAMDCLGSGSQGPRTDEGVRERFEELAVTLDRLEARGPQLEADELWCSLAPLLADCSGNTHRAELNVEKLWNPNLPGRGKSGLVELRSLRMQPTPDRQIAIAALFRALLARLAQCPLREPLVDWGATLHDRFALPFFLEQDLREVLADLRVHGFGLGLFEAVLLAQPDPWVRLEIAGATLEVRPALEFWPLLGDVASQEARGARLFDSSSARLQLLLRAPWGEDPGRVGAAGFEVPLTPVPPPGAGLTARAHDGRETAAFIAGVRFRAFTPHPGLHPGLSAQDPLRISWERARQRLAVEIHGWRPSGGSYPGLPADAQDAARRRGERVVPLSAAAAADTPLHVVPRSQRSTYCLDLRRLAGAVAARTAP